MCFIVLFVFFGDDEHKKLFNINTNKNVRCTFFRQLSHNMTTLSKEEYLKRYLSGDATDSKDKKKKKKKTKEKASAKIQPRMRIIDNDADVPSAAVPPPGATVKKVSFFYVPEAYLTYFSYHC